MSHAVRHATPLLFIGYTLIGALWLHTTRGWTIAIQVDRNRNVCMNLYESKKHSLRNDNLFYKIFFQHRPEILELDLNLPLNECHGEL